MIKQRLKVKRIEAEAHLVLTYISLPNKTITLLTSKGTEVVGLRQEAKF
jgi:hypothetical protein